MFQGKFAIITPALIIGALAERVYFRGYILFIALWFLVIYCPLCHWVWAADGWLFNLGALSSMACYFALRTKARLGYDDSLDCFGIHGVGSGLGVLLLSFIIRDSWMKDAAEAAGGAWNAWNQLAVQLAGIGVTVALAVVGTLAIYFVVEKSVGFRIEEQGEVEGLDQFLHGENGYGLVRSDFIT